MTAEIMRLWESYVWLSSWTVPAVIVLNLMLLGGYWVNRRKDRGFWWLIIIIWVLGSVIPSLQWGPR